MTSATLERTDLAHVLQTYNDVTERLMHSHEMLGREVCRLRDELHEKNAELRRHERLAALGEMAAGVAHEIRNPLGGISLYAAMLERDVSGQSSSLDMVRRLRRGVSTLESIVGDILAFAGEVRPHPRNFVVEPAIRSVWGQAALLRDETPTMLTMDPMLSETVLFCDPAQFERAMLNLMINALDAAGEGGCVQVRHAGSSADGALALIAMEDEGEGIDPIDLQRVFNPFFTTKDAGTGLGLAIVHRIAEANGGYVTAGNRPKGGAVFTMALPYAQEARDA